MSHERNSGQGRKDWQPTKAFFRSTPRSAEIHMVCGAILKRVDRLQSDPEVAEDNARKQTLYAELEMLGGRLIELDIKPHMNEKLPLEAYQSSPVTAVEWAAGQLLPMTGRNIASESDVMPIAEEFDVFDSDEETDGNKLIETSSMPPKYRQFAIDQQLAATMHMLLDIPVEKEEN